MTDHYSDELINAFLELLKEKDVTKISIVDLTNKCNSSRQTFYYHFKGIDDMIYQAIMNDTKNVCDNINTKDSWEVASKEYIKILSKYDLLIRKSVNTKKSLFVIDTITTSVEQYIRTFIKTKHNNVNTLNEFLYVSLISMVLYLILKEVEKEESNYESIIEFVSNGIKFPTCK